MARRLRSAATSRPPVLVWRPGMGGSRYRPWGVVSQFCPPALPPASLLGVTPGVVARSHAATLSLAVANVTVAAGRAALVWHTQSCAADAVASPLAAAPSAPNGSYVFDLSGAPAGQYRVCSGMGIAAGADCLQSF